MHTKSRSAGGEASVQGMLTASHSTFEGDEEEELRQDASLSHARFICKEVRDTVIHADTAPGVLI